MADHENVDDLIARLKELYNSTDREGQLLITGQVARGLDLELITPYIGEDQITQYDSSYPSPEEKEIFRQIRREISYITTGYGRVQIPIVLCNTHTAMNVQPSI